MAANGIKPKLSLWPKGKKSSAEFGDEIARLERDWAAAREGILNLESPFAAALRADDDAEADRIEGQRKVFERTVQRVRLKLPDLKEKLEAALNEERLELINHHRRVASEKFEALAAALTAASAANDAAIAASAAAHRELGSADGASLVACANFPYVNRDLVQHWISTVRQELLSAARTVPRSLTPTKHVPLPFVDPNKIIPHRPPEQRHGVALYHDPHGPQAAKPKAVPKVAPQPETRKRNRPLPPPVGAEPRSGMRFYEVRKSDFPHPETKSGMCVGDVFEWEPSNAQSALAASAIVPHEPKSGDEA